MTGRPRVALIAKVPRSRCPHCAKPLTAATDISGKALPPKPGALSVCAHCLGVCAFDKRLRLRRVTTTEFAGLPEETREAVARVTTEIMAGKDRLGRSDDDGPGKDETIH